MEQEKRSESSLVTIAAFTSVHEAHLAKSALDAAGIPAVLDNEHIVSMHWGYSNLVGGVKVLVESSRAEEARAILGTVAADIDPEEIADATSSTLDACKRCGGTEFDSRLPGRSFPIISWLLLDFPVGLPLRRRFCRNCGAPSGDE